MAVTTTAVSSQVPGAQRQTVTLVTFDSSYPTGGEPVTAATFQLQRLDHIMPFTARNAAGTLHLIGGWDHTNSKLFLAWGAASGAPFAEVANTTDLSAFTARITALGV